MLVDIASSFFVRTYASRSPLIGVDLVLTCVNLRIRSWNEIELSGVWRLECPDVFAKSPTLDHSLLVRRDVCYDIHLFKANVLVEQLAIKQG